MKRYAREDHENNPNPLPGMRMCSSRGDQTSDWFKDFVFLLAIDWIMHETTS